MKNLLITITAVTAMLALLFYEQIAAAILVIAYALAGALGLLTIGGCFFGGWYAVERLRVIRAGRIEAEKQAHVTIVSDNDETWVRDTDKTATWRNLTGTPSLYVNGQQAAPQAWEMELHRLRLAAMSKPGRVIEGQAHALPAPGESEAGPLNLLTVFTQPGLAYAVIGGQQTGKTFQARHIAAYWVQQGIKPVVIGPKWDKGEWGGCYLIGGGGNMDSVEWGIKIVRRLVEQRHSDTKTGHKQHVIQPIFFDDWTPIVDAVSTARALVLEATTLYASVNVVLYFILHSDTANAWGVDRKGAALKDNFVKLFIQPAYDDNGLIIRSKTQGFIRFAGETTERPTRLFTTPPGAMGRPVVITPASRGIVPTGQAARIIELHEAGHSKAEICRQVYGSVGGKQYQMLNEVLSR